MNDTCIEWAAFKKCVEERACLELSDEDTRAIFCGLGAQVPANFPGARRRKKKKVHRAPSMADIKKMAAAFAAATGLGFDDGLTPQQRAARREQLGISEEQTRQQSLVRSKGSVVGSLGAASGLSPEQQADRARRMQMKPVEIPRKNTFLQIERAALAQLATARVLIPAECAPQML